LIALNALLSTQPETQPIFVAGQRFAPQIIRLLRSSNLKEIN